MVEQNHLKNNSRIVELTNENMELQSKLDETIEQLNGALGEIQSAKKSHCIAIGKPIFYFKISPLDAYILTAFWG